MFLEAGLLTRRSVRQYVKGKKISQADMEDLLKIAVYAPSGYNKQPWEFYVIQNKEIHNPQTRIGIDIRALFT